MKIEDSFRVSVPVEEAWNVLLDVERIAPCMPGAQLEEVEGDEYRGNVKVKVGPITAQYKGAARIVEADESARRVVIKAEGRDTRGQGNASATVTATLVAGGGGGSAAGRPENPQVRRSLSAGNAGLLPLAPCRIEPVFDPTVARARPLVVLGIDPGVSCCGYGAVRRDGANVEALAYGVLRTAASAPLPERLAALGADLEGLVADLEPAALAVERVLFQVNARTA